jgi:hypothetical protein
MAKEAYHLHDGIDAHATNFFAAVEEFHLAVVVRYHYDAVRVLSEGVYLVIFGFFAFIALMKALTFLLDLSALFTLQRCACQLL